jgi:RNA polymerase sigma-70 factor (ECF subfamily)
VAGRALAGARLRREVRPARVNGVAGIVAMRDGEPIAVGAVTVRDRRIVAIDMLADRERLQELDLAALDR